MKVFKIVIVPHDPEGEYYHVYIRNDGLCCFNPGFKFRNKHEFSFEAKEYVDARVKRSLFQGFYHQGKPVDEHQASLLTQESQRIAIKRAQRVPNEAPPAYRP